MIPKITLLFAGIIALASTAPAQGNPYGEASRGLWQINAGSKSQSKAGARISPWTVTHGMNTRYQKGAAITGAALTGIGPSSGRQFRIRTAPLWAPIRRY